jgi:hypothetical protein
MKRRTFLASATALLAGVIGWRAAASSPESAVSKVIHKKLGYLKLDAEGVRRFAADLVVRKAISPARLRAIDAAGALYTGLSMSHDGALDNAVRHGEDRIVTQYLISSDFFKNGADKSRTVQYLGYYDPLVACNNPFARPATDTESSS